MIWRRDLIRFFRDRAQIASSLARPILWLIVLGMGMGSAFPGFGGMSYLEYLLPGIVGLNVLFASFLSAISVIWDREFGFLKEMLVAPISRLSIVLGKAASGATVALLQGMIVMAFVPVMGIPISLGHLVLALPAAFLIAFSMTSLGLWVASRMTSFEGFGTVANFIIMPIFFLSGAVFPLETAPPVLQALGRANPMTYGVAALRSILTGTPSILLWKDLAVVAAFSAVAVSAASWAFCRRS